MVVKNVQDDIEVVIDPNGNTIFLKDYQSKDQRIFGIIHKEDGSTMVLYKNLKKEADELKKKVEESDVFLVLLDKGYFNNSDRIEQFLYAKFLKKPMVILEENGILEEYSSYLRGCDIILKLPLTEDLPKDLTNKIKRALKKRNKNIKKNEI